MQYKQHIEPFLLGGVASCNAEICTFPIDLVKTRLQIQGQKIDEIANANQVRYRGMFHCFRMILRDQGFFALYNG